MQRPARYDTKNGKAIITYLASIKDTFATAAQIAEQLQNTQTPMSRPTIYRQLEKLVGEGKVRKYMFSGSSVSCFQYADPDEHSRDFPHLKCETCGEISNLDCDEISHVSQHISEVHAFQVNNSKTIFYGKCETCLLRVRDQGSGVRGQGTMVTRDQGPGARGQGSGDESCS